MFGMVVDCHVEDRLDLTSTEKRELIDVMEKHNPGEPHILTEMHCGISPDTNHDSASVIKYANLLLGVLVVAIDGLARGGVAHFCNDGAASQFANKDEQTA